LAVMYWCWFGEHTDAVSCGVQVQSMAQAHVRARGESRREVAAARRRADPASLTRKGARPGYPGGAAGTGTGTADSHAHDPGSKQDPVLTLLPAVSVCVCVCVVRGVR
jgi:hypothetical protein